MISFEDLLFCKLCTQYQLAPFEVMRETLREMERPGSTLRLLDGLAARGIRIAEGRADEINRQMEQYQRKLIDKVTGDVLLARRLLGAADAQHWRRVQQQQEVYRPLLGVLVQGGVVARDQAPAINEEVRQRLTKHVDGLVAEYRRTDFEGIGRPLTRGARSGKSTSFARPTAAVPGAAISRERMTSVLRAVPAGPGEEGALLPEHYRLVRKLGEGGMGIVYLARDQDGREVAVKVIGDAAKKPDAVERFKREIIATACFEHENVIKFYDGGGFDRHYFLAMEFVPGEELRHTLDREKRLPAARAVGIAKQILAGMGAAHEARVIHRDLKPENVMLTERAERDVVKVMDFGMARILEREKLGQEVFMTMTGELSGTPAYMAPEVLLGDAPTERADIYAIGLILFEMLTGRLPFDVSTPTGWIQAHMKKKPLTLAEVAPELGLPGQLQGALDRCFEKMARDRFESCEEMRGVLAMVEPLLG